MRSFNFHAHKGSDEDPVGGRVRTQIHSDIHKLQGGSGYDRSSTVLPRTDYVRAATPGDNNLDTHVVNKVCF